MRDAQTQYRYYHFSTNVSQTREQLLEVVFMTDFINFLHDHEQLDDFKKLVEGLLSGRIAHTNLAWISALHRGRYSACSSTCSMKYDKDYVEYFSLIYALFGSSAINILKGPGHFGAVVTHECIKSRYDPNDSRCNFAVPDVKILRNVQTGYPKESPCGFINFTLDMYAKKAEEGKQFVLSFDGKRVAQGFSGKDDAGQVNLWSREQPPIKESQETLQEERRRTKAMWMPSEACSSLDSLRGNAQNVLLCMSYRLKHLRNRLTSEFLMEKKLEGMAARNPGCKKSYEYALSFIYRNTTQMEQCVQRGLNYNRDVSKWISHTHDNTVHVSDTDEIPVNLNDLTTYFPLVPAEVLASTVDLTVESNSIYCSRGSDESDTFVKKCVLKADLLFDALGMGSLKEAKQFFRHFIRNGESDSNYKDSAAYTQFETEHEIHCLTTFLSYAVPSFLQPCIAFYETGPCIMHGIEKQNLIGGCANGILKCRKSEDGCTFDQGKGNHHTRLVKFKYILPQNESRPSFPMYEMQHNLVPESLALMNLYSCMELWIVFYTLISCTVISVMFDAELWERLFGIAEEKFGAPKINAPTRVHPMTTALRLQLETFVEKNCRLICEIPTVRGHFTYSLPKEIQSCYIEKDILCESRMDSEEIRQQSRMLSAEGNVLFERIHDVLRKAATEVVVFMLSDKDRKQEKDNTPNSSPLAYAMKGPSLSNEDLRYLVNSVRDELLKRKIPVLVEVYDGQWQQLVMTDETGEPLNRLRLANKTWKRIARLSKIRVIDEMLDTCAMLVGDKDLLSLKRLRQGETNLRNFRAVRGISGGITVESMGGNSFPRGVCKLFTMAIGTAKNSLCTGEKSSKGKTLSLKAKNGTGGNLSKKREDKGEGAINVQQRIVNLTNFPTEIVYDDSGEDDDEDYLPNLETSSDEWPRNIEARFQESIEGILLALSKENYIKWLSVEPLDIYPAMLQSQKKLVQRCSKKELQIVTSFLRQEGLHNYNTNGMTKSEMAVVVTQCFGGNKDFLKNVPRKGCKAAAVKRNPKTLKELCKHIVMTPLYDVNTLRVVYAQVVHALNLAKWRTRCKVNLKTLIPRTIAGKDTIEMDLFSYPEYSIKRKQIEARTLDYSHILTNIRMHICKGGYDFCSGEHFVQLCNERPDILSRSVVVDKVDPQNVFTAMRFFGHQVENFMHENGHADTAEFIQLVRNWHRACDERGLKADERVEYLYNMHSFLTKGIDFDVFPAVTCCKYVRGMPVTTFEALLQNISTRLICYSLSLDDNYNTRSISTLSNESFFSDLTRLDKEGRAYPKACNIPKLINKVVTLNYFKHKKNKTFHLAPTLKSTYPVQLSEEDLQDLIRNDAVIQQGMYRNHFFDYADEHLSYRVRKDEISHSLAPQRSVDGIRHLYRTDESKILPEKRERLPPRIPYKEFLQNQTKEFTRNTTKKKT